MLRKWVYASHAEEGFPVKVSFVIRKWWCDAKAVYPYRHNPEVAIMKSKPQNILYIGSVTTLASFPIRKDRNVTNS